MSTLAEKLRKARKKTKISMNDVVRLSEKASVDYRGTITQGYISRLESGKEANPSYQKIITLCKIYKIEPGSLF